MNQSCPQCNSDGGFCNFCGNKPPNAITGEILQKAGEFANEEQRKIFYKDQDPYEAQGKEYKGNCTCGCHTSEHSDIEMKINGCDLCYKDEVHQDPYLSQGKNFRVHHPTQPKTQVERWGEEKRANEKFIAEHEQWHTYLYPSKERHCPLTGSDNCNTREEKNDWIDEQIAKATQPIHSRYPTGTFADDIENAPEYIKKSLFGHNFKKVTLLDKIKLWLKK